MTWLGPSRDAVCSISGQLNRTVSVARSHWAAGFDDDNGFDTAGRIVTSSTGLPSAASRSLVSPAAASPSSSTVPADGAASSSSAAGSASPGLRPCLRPCRSLARRGPSRDKGAAAALADGFGLRPWSLLENVSGAPAPASSAFAAATLSFSAAENGDGVLVDLGGRPRRTGAGVSSSAGSSRRASMGGVGFGLRAMSDPVHSCNV